MITFMLILMFGGNPEFDPQFADFRALTGAPRMEITYTVFPLDSANARADKTPNGWEITIDAQFFNYYRYKPQLKRLLFHEYAHIVFGLPDTSDGGLMDPDAVYTPLRERDLETLKAYAHVSR